MRKEKRKTPRALKVRSVKNWTLAGAVSCVPLVTRILRELREVYCANWHLFRLNKYQLVGGPYDAELADLNRNGANLLKELESLNVLAYQSPQRGIALFPFLVSYLEHNRGTTTRPAYFVYKDSRDKIGSFIFNDELCVYSDLYGWERPVPEAWLTGPHVLDANDSG